MAVTVGLVVLLSILPNGLASCDSQIDCDPSAKGLPALAGGPDDSPEKPRNVLLQQDKRTGRIVYDAEEGAAVHEVPMLNSVNASTFSKNSSAGEDATTVNNEPTARLVASAEEQATVPGLAQVDEPAISAKKAGAEFIAMTLFVFFGCGSAMSVAKDPGWVLQVSLTFGLAITVLAYAIGHYSGGQINCAVTFGLVLTGNLSVGQGLVNFLGQMLGSVMGASLLKVSYPNTKDQTGGLGTNGVSEGWTSAGALVAEAVATFLLMYVVLEVAVNTASAALATLAPIPIGLAVFLAHSVLIPIDGCSINPTRSFGPALVQMLSGDSSAFRDMWIFWLGPLAGAAAAAGVYTIMA